MCRLLGPFLLASQWTRETPNVELNILGHGALRLVPLLIAGCRGDSLREVVIAAIVLQQQNKMKTVAIFKILSLRRLSIQIDLDLSFT